MGNSIPEFVKVGDRITARRWNNVVEDVYAIKKGLPPVKRLVTGYNNSGEAIPEFGVVALGTDRGSSRAKPHVNFEKPGTGLYAAVTGPIPTLRKGHASIINRFYPSPVLCSDITIVAGETVGPSNSFSVSRAGNGLFTVSDYVDGIVWVVTAQGIGGTDIATTTEIIPARNGLVAGGPVTVTRQKLVGNSFADDGTVQVYSWVNSPSKDPADMTNPNGILFIYISQDNDGTWWWTGEDCDPDALAPAYAVIDSGTAIPADGTKVIYVGDAP